MDFRKGREHVNLAASWTHDVLCANSPNQQSIGDERTMTAPRHRFSTHDCDLFVPGQLDQFLETLLKLRRLHVIRVTPEGGISPPHIDRIALRMAQTAQSRRMNVTQASFLQCTRQ